jgi:hypothetical protein
LQVKILEGKVGLLGETHPSALIAIQDLAKTRRGLGQEEASMALLQDFIEKSVQNWIRGVSCWMSGAEGVG